MRPPRTLWLLALLLITLPAAAQTGRLAGRVTDASSGEPLPGVNVIVAGTTVGATTDVDGYYSIINVDPGTYDVRASFIGFAPQTVQGVEVNIDLTTTVDFAMSEEAVGLDEVVVTATTPIIQRDISGSQRNIGNEEIQAGKYQNVNSVVASQVGVASVDAYEDRPGIRGSSMSESLFIVDGIAQGDALTNRPLYKVNLDAIQEMKIETGGFSAEYGNLRSGVINVVTKEGGTEYSGSVDFQYSPPGLKHFGPMLTGHDSPIVRPLVDPAAGAFTGVTAEGQPNVIFEGWNEVATTRFKPGDAHYGEPMELYARWLWRHRSQDSIDELLRLQREGIVDLEFAGDPQDFVFQEYGNRPDWRGSATFGGPVPLTNDRVRFFLAFDGSSTEYAFRVAQPTYEDRQIRGKLTTNLAKGLKLNFNSLYSWQRGSDGTGSSLTDMIAANPYRVGLGRGTFDTRKIWYPHCQVPGTGVRQIYGLDLTHTLSPNTFYEVQFSHHRTDYYRDVQHRDTAPVPGAVDPEGNLIRSSVGGSGVQEGRIGSVAYADSMAAAGAPGWESWRDWARIRIGDQWYDEAPFGHGPANWKDVTNRYPMETCPMPFNDTYSRAYDMQASVTSQVTRNNQLKAGMQVHADKIYQSWNSIDAATGRRRLFSSDANQWRGAFYAQDKLEYEGFVANMGVRLDWMNTGKQPMIDYTAFQDTVAGPYSVHLLPGNTMNEEGEIDIDSKIPLRSVTKMRISPRLGISHPISSVGKIFFNYGHMYQWPSAFQLYRAQYHFHQGGRPVEFANPSLDPPKTVAYELGYEQNLFDRMNLRLTGYYKDIKREISNVQYVPLAAGGNYRVFDNRRFRDVRGIEAFLELRRRTVPFVSGWASFNYMVESGGRFGYDRYFENPARQPREVPAQVSSPDVRPIVKLNLDVHTPDDFGPQVGGFSLLGGATVNVLYTWQRGAQDTWNPDQIPYVEDNVRWRGYQRWDLRFQKDLFTSGRYDAIFYVDVTNLFNNRNMTRPSDGRSGRWAWDLHDWWNKEYVGYMESLDLKVERDGSLTGEDRPGDFPKDWLSYQHVPIRRVDALPESGSSEGFYYDRSSGEYMQWVDGAFRKADSGQVEEVLDSKAYIDMPAFTPWTFLERRDIHFGVKLRF